jgi:hypothetical protein
MNTRILFGNLFFLLSLFFCAYQLVTLPTAEHLGGVSSLLQFCSTAVCLLLASLAAQSGHKTAMTGISVIAFSVCFLALLIGGILAMKGTSEMTPVKYVIFLAYGGIYGCFGLVFSLIAGKSAAPPPPKDV